jgi:hypothetical protein
MAVTVAMRIRFLTVLVQRELDFEVVLPVPEIGQGERREVETMLLLETEGLAMKRSDRSRSSTRTMVWMSLAIFGCLLCKRRFVPHLQPALDCNSPQIARTATKGFAHPTENYCEFLVRVKRRKRSSVAAALPSARRAAAVLHANHLTSAS